MSEKLNQNALIKLLKITHYTLRKWEQDGMPYEMGEYGPHSNRYDVAEIMQWHISTGSGDADLENMSATEAKRRQTVAAALSAELDLAVKRSQLAVIEDMMKEFSNALIEVRAAITSQANRLSGLLAHQSDQAVYDLLNKDAEEMLAKLSAYEHQ